MLYFAYGSNLNQKQMHERCPHSKFVGVGTLKDYKFVFDGFSKQCNGAVANIVPSAGAVVHGGLYDIHEDDLESLDEYEGFERHPKLYDRAEVEIYSSSGPVWAVTYYRSPQTPGEPSSSYRQTILQGLKDCGMPA